jgi:outer membrane protein assembly factor BamD (BamD/ComL family)
MRLWFVSKIAIVCLLLPTLLGCESLTGPFQKPDRPGLEKQGVFGLRRAGERKFDPEETLDPMGARSVDRVVFDDLMPGNLGNTVQTRFLGKQDPEEAQRIFAEAQQIYSEAISQQKLNPTGKEHVASFIKAAKKYRLAASRWPESTVEEDSLFFEGESYFFADAYVESNRAYEKLIALYSGTRYLDKAEQHRFAIARYWLEMAETSGGLSLNDPRRPRLNLVGEARRILHRIRIDDPTGKFADDATNALADAYFKDKRYADAADTYEDLRRNYPGSSFQYHAHLFELKSRMLSYQGKSYDELPLRKADELMRSIVQQFPEQARKDQEFLAQEATRIRTMLAERDLAMAEYFEGRGENRAAKYYYQQVAENYEDTKLADKVQEQIAEVAAKPPTPPQRGQWLINLFPDQEDETPILKAGNEKIFR